MNAATPTGRAAPRAGRSTAPGRTGRRLLGGLRRDAPPPRSGAAHHRQPSRRASAPPASASLGCATRRPHVVPSGDGHWRCSSQGRWPSWSPGRWPAPSRSAARWGATTEVVVAALPLEVGSCPRRHDDTDRAPPGSAGARRRPRDRSPTASASQRRSPRARCWWTHAWPGRAAVRAAQGWLRATRSSRCRSASRRSRRVGPSRIRSCRSVTGWTSTGPIRPTWRGRARRGPRRGRRVGRAGARGPADPAQRRRRERCCGARRADDDGGRRMIVGPGAAARAEARSVRNRIRTPTRRR